MVGKKITELKIDDEAFIEKTITESDVYLFAGITMDFNPIHINTIKANDSIFKGRVVHGILTSGLISAVIGTQLPGIGTIYIAQNLTFVKPVYIGDTIRASVIVKRLINEKNIAILETVCINQEGAIVIRGEATVMPPKY